MRSVDAQTARRGVRGAVGTALDSLRILGAFGGSVFLPCEPVPAHPIRAAPSGRRGPSLLTRREGQRPAVHVGRGRVQAVAGQHRGPDVDDAGVHVGVERAVREQHTAHVLGVQ